MTDFAYTTPQDAIILLTSDPSYYIIELYLHLFRARINY